MRLRNTVSKVLKKADELNISWPLDETMTDDALESLLFPKVHIPQELRIRSGGTERHSASN